MRKVLITLTEISYPQGARAKLDTLRQTLISKANKYNVLPLLVSSSMGPAQIDALYEAADGVLFPGGGDINPTLYNQIKLDHTQIDHPDRDTLEYYLIQKTLRDKKPFFGICRGMQMLAIAQGGTLHQHIIDSDIIHGVGPGEGGTYDDLFDEKYMHEIHIHPNSRSFAIVQKATIYTNSAHHQAIDTIGTDLRVAATSDDGIIEIIEHTDPAYFCFGIQGHPEAQENGELENFWGAFTQSL